MSELLELILSILQDFFATDNSDSVVDVTPSESGDKPKILATSPSGDEEPKKPKGDSEICKKLTDKVTEMHNNTWKPITVLEKVDEDGRKHVAVAAGRKLPIIGDKFVSGSGSFPAPGPAPDKK